MLIDNIILSQLIYNEEYVRRVLPFIKDEYFSDNAQKTIFSLIGSYIKKYNGPPSKEALQIELDNQNMADGLYKSSNQLLESLEKQEIDIEWLIDNTEKFCQDKALFNAISQSIKLIDEKDKGSISKGAIPSILQEALAVSFTTNIGHDYIEDSDDRFMFYHRKEDRIPFDLDMMNTITGGGLIPKTLNVILAGCVHPETKIKIRLTKKY